MFESLTERLQGVFRHLGGHGTITEKDLDQALREVRLALLEADVNHKVVREFVQHIKERALGAEITKSLTPMQQIIDIVNQELIEILGGGHARLSKAPTPPSTYMLVGLKGSGKTTTTAKLALHLRRQGEKPLMASTDTERVAAAEQIAALGKQLNIPVLAQNARLRPAQLARAALDEAKRMRYSSVLLDTVGYVQLDSDGLQSLQEIKEALSPTEVLLVADAMTGQEAVHAAEEFRKAVPLSGLILTKLDGDARGGAALSIRSVTGIPIKFVGTGEKPDALEAFYPDRFASRILGMGDILTLIEKAKEEFTQEDVASLTKRIKKGALTLDDFLDQYQRMKRMGPLPQIMGLIPGFTALKNKVNLDQIDDGAIKRVEAIIYSMTSEERKNPDIIDGSRRRRIARGSGTTPADVNRLLSQFKEAKRLMQMISTGRGANISPLLR